MNISQNFPELNEGQIRMLEHYIEGRAQAAVEKYKATQKKAKP